MKIHSLYKHDCCIDVGFMPARILSGFGYVTVSGMWWLLRSPRPMGFMDTIKILYKDIAKWRMISEH